MALLVRAWAVPGNPADLSTDHSETLATVGQGGQAY